MLSAVLGLSFLFGILPSMGLSVNPMELCEQMMGMGTMSSNAMNHGGMMDDDCPMTTGHDGMPTNSDDCVFLTDCCIIRATAPATIPAPSTVKISQVHVLFAVLSVDENLSSVSEKPIPIHLSNSYSPPLLFLANSSFLI